MSNPWAPQSQKLFLLDSTDFVSWGRSLYTVQWRNVGTHFIFTVQLSHEKSFFSSSNNSLGEVGNIIQKDRGKSSIINMLGVLGILAYHLRLVWMWCKHTYTENVFWHKQLLEKNVNSHVALQAIQRGNVEKCEFTLSFCISRPSVTDRKSFPHHLVSYPAYGSFTPCCEGHQRTKCLGGHNSYQSTLGDVSPPKVSDRVSGVWGRPADVIHLLSLDLDVMRTPGPWYFQPQPYDHKLQHCCPLRLVTTAPGARQYPSPHECLV